MRLSYATLRLASLSAYYFSISRLSRYAKTAAERAGWKYVEDNKPSFKLASINFHIRFFFLFFWVNSRTFMGCCAPQPPRHGHSISVLSLSRSFGWLQATSAVYADVRHSDTTGHDQPTNDCRTLAPRVCTAKRLEHGGAQNAYRPDEGSRRRRDGLARRP